MLLSTSLIGLAFTQPMRIRYSLSSGLSRSTFSHQAEYLSDWLQGHPGLVLLIGLLLATAMALPIMMAFSSGLLDAQVQSYLYLQGFVAGLATAGIFLFTRFGMAFDQGSYFAGYNALLMLGLWSSLGSLLWASGRLDRWMLSR